MLAEADSQQARFWPAAARAQRIMQVGLSEAAVLLRKISSLRRPAAVRPVARRASSCRRARSRWCPSGCSSPGTNGENGKAQPANGLLGMLFSLLVAEKSGFQWPTRTRRKRCERFPIG